MQGIQQMFRQHNVDKQSSIESWHSASNNSSCSSYTNGRVSVESVNEMKPWNQGLFVVVWHGTQKDSQIFKFHSQIVFLINFMKFQSPRLPSLCQILRNHCLRNSIALVVAIIHAGVVARQIPIKWWWDVI